MEMIHVVVQAGNNHTFDVLDDGCMASEKFKFLKFREICPDDCHDETKQFGFPLTIRSEESSVRALGSEVGK